MNANARADVSPGFVELQLLRHGPAHNQLLSPLTEYLALCGDHSNATLRIPLEHAALETRLRAMRYFDSEQTRIDQLRETARIASDLLAKVPGLIADLASGRSGGKPFVHLSIASRASELALFPFELAIAPDGFPGAGQPLCLQKQLPVCLTRRSKNVRNDDFDWDRPVKILLVASDAGGEIPIQQHYALLRKLIEPWVGTMPSDSPETKGRKRRRVLRLLVQANVDAIERALCDEVTDFGDPFTHIHVLAHGCDLPDSDRRSGIALYHPTLPGQIDAVDGKRLAEALGCLPDFPSSSKRNRGPTVVTLATCGSADQGGVTVPGASLAFELHDSGIPLVVGSQFPLSSDGSVIMTESLYRGFLSGRDPRSIIWETRRALHANLPQLPASGAKTERTAHDWASMTVYAALPEKNFDDVLASHRRDRQRRRMNVRLGNTHLVLKALRQIWSPTNASPNAAEPPYWRDILNKADTAVRKFEKWVRKNDSDNVTVQVTNEGILASAQKQVGLFYLQASLGSNALASHSENEHDDEHGPKDLARDGENFLRLSRQSYRHIFESCRDEGWALVQFMALEFALRGDFDDADWTVAYQLSRLEQHVPDVQRRIWALAALLELQFLTWLKADMDRQPIETTGNSLELATRIRDLFSEAPGDVFSAKRQFERYVDDFADLASASRSKRMAEDYDARRIERQIRRKSFLPRRTADVTNEPNPLDESIAVQTIRGILRVFDDVDFSKLKG